MKSLYVYKLNKTSILAAGFFSFCACHNSIYETPMSNKASLRLGHLYSSSAPRSSTWLGNMAYGLDKHTFSLLLNDEIPAIRLRNFVPKDNVAQLSTTISDTVFSLYENVYPPIGKIGITQFEHSSKNKKEYFDQVIDACLVRDRIFKESKVNPLELLKNVLSTLGFEVHIAYEPEEGAYFAGLIRNMGGAADLHFDYAPYDAPDWSIGAVKKQVAFNLYVKLPAIGGETIVYNKLWEPGVYEIFSNNDARSSYGFKKELIKGVNHMKIKPSLGDVWLFNSRNFHEVLSSEGRDRFSISCFIGQTDSPTNLVIWS